MKLNKIISIAVVCIMLISCIPAFASTTATPETYVITSGNAKVADFIDDGNGTYIAKSVLNGYSHAGNTVFRYGQGTSSERIEVPLDSTTGKFTLDKILRFTSTVSLTLKPTAFNFGTFYYKNGSTLTNPAGVNTAVNAASLYPQQGDVVTVDSVVDLNTLTSYFYINNQYVGSHVLTADKISDATSLKFGNALLYVGQSGVTTVDTEICRVSNVKRTIYPAGTTIESVQNAILGTVEPDPEPEPEPEPDPEPEEPGEIVTGAYNILTGNPNIASYTDDGTGTYVAKAVLGGNYANTQGALYQYGDGTERIALTLNSQTGKFSANKILHYTSTVDMTVAATHMTFNTPYMKNGNTNVFGTTVNGINYRPQAGDTAVIDTIVDLNTLTTYYYVNQQLVGSDTFTAPADATSLEFYKTMVYMGNNTVTTAGTELYRVRNIKRTIYPAGTTLAYVQEKMMDVYRETAVVPQVLYNAHRFTVTPKSGSDGVYELKIKGTASHNQFTVPMNVEISSDNSGYSRATFTVTPKTNIYYAATKLNIIHTEDGTEVGTASTLTSGTTATIPSIGTNVAKFDVVVNKANGEVKYYINGNLFGTYTYAGTAGKKLVARDFGFYFGIPAVLDAGTLIAEISNAKVYNYPAGSSFAEVEAAIKGNTGVYTEIIAPQTRGNVTLSNDTTHTIFTSQAKSGASDAPNSRMILKTPIVFGTTTDKYVVFNSKIKFTKHTNDFAFNMTLFDGGSNRVAGNAFAVQQGDEYVAKVIVDVANKKAYFYMDNFLVSTNDITISQVNLLAFFMNNYDDEKAGLQAGEVVYGQSDLNAVHYTSEYTGTLSDVVAAEIGSDIENCSLRTAMYSEYGANDNKTEEFMAENYRLAVIANNFNVEDYKCIIAGYNLDEAGNEILAFTKKIYSSNYIYDAIPKDFDVLKVFLWDSSNNPVMKVYYPELCRR